SGDKIIIADELDPILDKLGVYESKDKAEEGALLCEAFDGIRDDTRTTGSTIVHISDAKLSIFGATTGNRYSKLMQQWKNNDGFYGIHNRMTYLAVSNKEPLRPQHLINRQKVLSLPSIAHILIVCHCLGDIEYRFREISDDESMSTTMIRSSQHQQASTKTAAENKNDATNEKSSAFFYTFNKTADLYASPTSSTEEQLKDLYSKVLEIFPRYCVLFQIFKNVVHILNETTKYINFDDGDHVNKHIDDKFVTEIKLAIKRLLITDNVPRNQMKMPILYIELNTCVTIWSYYEHIFNIALTTFDMHTILPLTTINILSTQREAARKILLYPYNVFSRTTFLGKSPIDRRDNSPLHNYPHKFDEGISELIKSKLIEEDQWLRKVQYAYMKVQPPDDLQEKIDFEKKLNEYNITFDQYENVYKNSSYPPSSALSLKFVTHMGNYSKYVKEYHKYETDKMMKEKIDELLEENKIKKVIMNNENRYELTDRYLQSVNQSQSVNTTTTIPTNSTPIPSPSAIFTSVAMTSAPIITQQCLLPQPSLPLVKSVDNLSYGFEKSTNPSVIDDQSVFLNSDQPSSRGGNDLLTMLQETFNTLNYSTSSTARIERLETSSHKNKPDEQNSIDQLRTTANKHLDGNAQVIELQPASSSTITALHQMPALTPHYLLTIEDRCQTHLTAHSEEERQTHGLLHNELIEISDSSSVNEGIVHCLSSLSASPITDEDKIESSNTKQLLTIQDLNNLTKISEKINNNSLTAQIFSASSSHTFPLSEITNEIQQSVVINENNDCQVISSLESCQHECDFYTDNQQNKKDTNEDGQLIFDESIINPTVNNCSATLTSVLTQETSRERMETNNITDGNVQ
ncbi:unnamed protein product, partial [Didymodactylos carnosus]